MHIKIGQRWITRAGDLVRVTADRQLFAVIPRWRWGLSNGQIADDNGRVGINNECSSDLISEAVESDVIIKPAHSEGMDSTIGPLV